MVKLVPEKTVVHKKKKSSFVEKFSTIFEKNLLLLKSKWVKRKEIVSNEYLLLLLVHTSRRFVFTTLFIIALRLTCHVQIMSRNCVQALGIDTTILSRNTHSKLSPIYQCPIYWYVKYWITNVTSAERIYYRNRNSNSGFGDV